MSEISIRILVVHGFAGRIAAAEYIVAVEHNSVERD
tara:strand:- start:7 stop:114 length:108 start_codon:yes stop_codon:yes gene_type:complete